MRAQSDAVFGRLARAGWNNRISSDRDAVDANEDGKVIVEELSHARATLDIGDALDMML